MTWRERALKGQRPPQGEWRTWYILGGRGGGKTWTGSHQLAEWITDEDNAGKDWAIVAPTFGDARDVCMEGPSGLLRALGLPRSYRGWNRSHGELFLPGGGRVYTDGADDGALRIQGTNLAGLWADEVGLWRSWRLAWQESIAFAVRVDPARIVATGTPKRGHPLVKELYDDPRVAKTVVRTLDNRANLSEVAIAELLRRYEGTTLGQQELEGIVLADVPGALWKREDIRYDTPPQRWAIEPGGKALVDDYSRLVVAVDPAVTYGPDSDETGIVVAGARGDMGYIVDDLSGRFSPDQWAQRVVTAYHVNRADAVIAEANNGGELVRMNIQRRDPTVNVKLVHASKGKVPRAEPVSALYEQGRVYHVRPFPELEDQLCTYTKESAVSPDRLDALVWGLQDLLLSSVTITNASVANV
jgi:predicted phage terminase large subunit-like protein